ncbi:outer membrane protein assembly factor BamB family protein [Dictyobacter formicarum]|uniref:Pyrrolo-quinoline quinone repeat domain-containing protein n=1 Tax=Dictyobacter formicarum TaxID=2778368 RepID=A0ABQ3VIA7_9CHLR|nr:PQQ-binding-like beta-propeller repeat protein [Dictyobacter formicarum]GHO85515.1 hypothetical protein KSZ_35210 [Dictyobacter formicarum]
MIKNLRTRSTSLSDEGIYVAWKSFIYKVGLAKRRVHWRREIAGLGSSLIVDVGIVYTYSVQAESIVYAFQTSTGNLLWSTHVAPYMFHAGMQINELVAMTLVDGILYVLSSMGDIYALDKTSGAILWRCDTLPLNENHLGTIDLTIARDILYYTNQNQLFAVDIQRCQQHWMTTIPAPQIFFAHTLSNTMLFATADLDPEGSYIYAFATETGKRLWQSELLPDAIFEAPMHAGDLIICYGGTTIYALNACDGKIRWEHFVGHTSGLRPCIENGQLYLCSGSGYQQDIWTEQRLGRARGALLSLNCAHGSLAWYRNLAIAPSMFHVKRGNIYVNRADANHLYVFNAHDGTTLWQLDLALDTARMDIQPPEGFGSTLIVIPDEGK